MDSAKCWPRGFGVGDFWGCPLWMLAQIIIEAQSQSVILILHPPIGSVSFVSLPEFMNFNLFGKTILVVNVKFGLFLGHPLSQ